MVVVDGRACYDHDASTGSVLKAATTTAVLKAAIPYAPITCPKDHGDDIFTVESIGHPKLHMYLFWSTTCLSQEYMTSTFSMYMYNAI